MAFGKAPIKPWVRNQLKENALDRLVEATEVKMLKVPSADTPLGEAALISATERAMTRKSFECNRCKKICGGVSVALTGTCATCWEKEKDQ
jgi:hypothetical protein